MKFHFHIIDTFDRDTVSVRGSILRHSYLLWAFKYIFVKLYIFFQVYKLDKYTYKFDKLSKEIAV